MFAIKKHAQGHKLLSIALAIVMALSVFPLSGMAFAATATGGGELTAVVEEEQSADDGDSLSDVAEEGQSAQDDESLPEAGEAEPTTEEDEAVSEGDNSATTDTTLTAQASGSYVIEQAKDMATITIELQPC